MDTKMPYTKLDTNHIQFTSRNKRSVFFILLPLSVIFLLILLLLTQNKKKETTISTDFNRINNVNQSKQLIHSPVKSDETIEDINQVKINSDRDTAINKGYIRISRPSEKQTYQLNQEIVLPIEIIFPGQSLVSFDIILAYDKKKLRLEKKAFSESNFDFVFVEKDNYTVITGMKKIQVREPVILNESRKVIELHFKTLGGGTNKVSLVDRFGGEYTQLVNDKSEIFYPELEGSVEFEVLD